MQLLETFSYYQYADYKTIQRGQQYFRDRRVYDVEDYDDYTVCQVEGNNDDYEVSISLTGRNKIRTECTCPYAEFVELLQAHGRLYVGAHTIPEKRKSAG